MAGSENIPCRRGDFYTTPTESTYWGKKLFNQKKKKENSSDERPTIAGFCFRLGF